ncbi:hypothetical protein [Candidatus Nanohalococcus occultus]|uniref:Uncharacterized protein n=1 Tax=Candidatus Nanohalococcus occultus TaxID=2978047 RepID=A0ABY8CFF5_9ARCH|nr:hypothetical protein SVXNc_0954 [Candidatus Nanohaloarchaeota archaeon SVXNc]
MPYQYEPKEPGQSKKNLKTIHGFVKEIEKEIDIKDDGANLAIELKLEDHDDHVKISYHASNPRGNHFSRSTILEKDIDGLEEYEAQTLNTFQSAYSEANIV